MFNDYRQISWFIASIYLLCGAFRLARFNCLSAMAEGGGSKDFLGFPIPSAAGLVASLTLLIIHFHEKEKTLGGWNYLIAIVLVFLSAMMVSTVRYPSFKSLGLRSKSTFTKAIGAALFLGLPADFEGKSPLLRAAGVFHAVSRLWLRAAQHLAGVAPGN